MAQSVKPRIFDFGSEHDLTIREMESRVGLHADSMKPARDLLSPSVFLSPRFPHLPSLSLKINLKKLKKIRCINNTIHFRVEALRPELHI